MTFRKIPLALLIFTLSAGCAFARNKKEPKFEPARQLTPEQAALVERAIAQEKVLIRNIQQRTPLVETYIQDTKPDVKLYEVPIADHYMLSRVDFGKTFFDKAYTPKEQKSRHGFFKGSMEAITDLTKALHLDQQWVYSNTGFMQMMFLDPTGFDQQHYVFSFVRPEFLGSVRTWVFDVHPKADVKGIGRFYGRIWVEDEGGNVVRFNGTYTSAEDPESKSKFFHFDSWRMNVQPGIWLPVAVYVEETKRGEGESIGLKAQTHFWGYSLKLPTRDSENVSVRVDNAVDKSDDSQDVGPLQASRLWVTQAENNVIDRLVEAGLVAPLDPGGYEEKVLGQIVINLVVPNNLAFTDQIHCRVLLTDTVEATTVGNTILISKGLIDSLPSEEAIASVIAMELAHIAMGHHIDTRYAFNDRLLFPDTATFQRIDMNHTEVDNGTAAKRAMEYLEASMYKDKLANAGLYFKQLVDRAKVLKALNTPTAGRFAAQGPTARRGWPDWCPWRPQINWDDMAQTAALPLGSWLKTDPWDDKVHMLNAKRYAPMNARDKMPFEVTPIFYKLQRYDAAARSPAGQRRPPASGQRRTAGRSARQRSAGATAAATPERRGARTRSAVNGCTESAVVTKSTLRARAWCTPVFERTPPGS